MKKRFVNFVLIPLVALFQFSQIIPVYAEDIPNETECRSSEPIKYSYTSRHEGYSVWVDYYNTGKLPDEVEIKLLEMVKDRPDLVSYHGGIVLASTNIKDLWGSFGVSVLKDICAYLMDNTPTFYYGKVNAELLIVQDYPEISDKENLKKIMDIIPEDELSLSIKASLLPEYFKVDDSNSPSRDKIQLDVFKQPRENIILVVTLLLTVILTIVSLTALSILYRKKAHEENIK